MRIVLEVAEVLKYMAAENLVHRDVKPGNIMLTHNAQVKLIDLGFCAQQDLQRPRGLARSGRSQYLSPEQAEGGASADLRSDIYSLGVTLFQLTVGRLPFEGPRATRRCCAKAVMESLSSPELKSRGLSPHLHYFIEKMMAKEADIRLPVVGGADSGHSVPAHLLRRLTQADGPFVGHLRVYEAPAENAVLELRAAP